MKKDDRTLLKRIGIDALGVLLIIGSILFGWIPGPGGIPLFLAGLGLLATNHEWARRIFVEIKERGMSISETIFRDHPVLVLTYDILAVILLITGGILFSAATNNIYAGLSIVVFFLGVSLFLGNRKRANKITAWAKNIANRNK
ncbi:hypothetical protein KC950_01995 [Candidatus Saccharibacteria bacterium]|nr:hypothetical protein [Candidatus Saccharibacteria bacterium]